MANLSKNNLLSIKSLNCNRLDPATVIPAKAGIQTDFVYA
jgi:hypothetical protein